MSSRSLRLGAEVSSNQRLDAFAQRYADAVYAEGRSTTPPDVLQDLMDHQDFKTTMTYYNPRELHQMGAFPQVAC